MEPKVKTIRYDDMSHVQVYVFGVEDIVSYWIYLQNI